MQQIPSRNKVTAAIVKPCFLPDEGQVWVAGDMASFEVRVFAHLVNNASIIQAYKDDPELDFHQYVADISGLVRNAEYSGQPNAKQMNLSMIFNSGNGAIAHKMGMDYKWTSFENNAGETITYRKAGPEAMKVIKRYHSRIHGVKDLAERAANLAKSSGYVFTQMGRRLRFPKGYKAYKASGLLIQATSADINKENWIMVEEELDGVGHMIVNTHDDYNLSLPEDWKPHFKRVQERIQSPRLRVPLILELSGAGENWWKAIS
jgi:DNA polymerase I-like protein with 3'-5' exonuclease and polymerase domains